MKRQGGFTLIELVVVIVILGILAVTAAPRFLNLQDDARNASLEGLKGAMAGAAGIVYGSAAINGLEAVSSAQVSGAQGSGDIDIAFGYPKASSTGIGNAVTGIEDWSIVSSESDDTKIVYTFKDQGSTNTENCFVTYKQATADSVATSIVTECK
ncbi:type II secretion system protein [Vibrio renipiscarius]|uniref:type II secretion system protein n=1 Tax=Vibrio renipiscarius TaxID=1461322 RepID=UPI00354C2A2A